MADETLTQTVVVPPPAPTPLPLPVSMDIETGEWKYSVAAKKVAVGLSKLSIAFLSGPSATHAFNYVSKVVDPLGVHVTVDDAILSKALPGIIFAGLVIGHDWLKLKKPDWKWLG